MKMFTFSAFKEKKNKDENTKWSKSVLPLTLNSVHICSWVTYFVSAGFFFKHESYTTTILC